MGRKAFTLLVLMGLALSVAGALSPQIPTSSLRFAAHSSGDRVLCAGDTLADAGSCGCSSTHRGVATGSTPAVTTGVCADPAAATQAPPVEEDMVALPGEEIG